MPMLFQELSLHPSLLRAVERAGFTTPTPVQEQTIPPALAGKNLLVSAPTGSGKTAAFLLPMLHRFLLDVRPRSATRALVLVPTRELALQIEKEFVNLAAFTQLRCGRIIGGEAFKHQVASLRRNPEVIIATPGRLAEHVEKKTTDFRDLEVLVFDEADRMLDLGLGESVEAIVATCRAERCSWLFSASLTHRSMGSLRRLVGEAEQVGMDQPRSLPAHVLQEVLLADNRQHKEKLVAALLAQEGVRKAFVFCNTRDECQQLGNLLKYLEFRAAFLHGEVTQDLRKQVMNRFRDGSINVLVATDVAARGLDVGEVDLVINFTVAQSGTDHLHRSGRTGRAGAAGRVVTLVSDTEWNLMASIERYLKGKFARITLPGLEGSYRGPKKVKNSGKAAGTKKKKEKGKEKEKTKKAAPKKTAPKPLRPGGGDGSGPLRRQKPQG
jgi:ATP-dependent RNA helicase SrmB